jgi:hypothetical protein
MADTPERPELPVEVPAGLLLFGLTATAIGAVLEHHGYLAGVGLILCVVGVPFLFRGLLDRRKDSRPPQTNPLRAAAEYVGVTAAGLLAITAMAVMVTNACYPLGWTFYVGGRWVTQAVVPGSDSWPWLKAVVSVTLGGVGFATLATLWVLWMRRD